MKKTIIGCLLALSFCRAEAQLTVSAKSFELESVNKHKNWKIIDAGVDAATKNVYVKFASPSCDIEKSVTSDLKTITTTTTFKGLAWKVDKLLFDNNFSYLSTEPKSYKNTIEAIAENEHVYGRKYSVTFTGGVLKALTGVAMPTGQIDNSYMGSTIVMGFGGITGFKIGTSRIGIKVGGETSKWGPDQCYENAVVYKIDNVDAKEQKGQRWIPMFNHPIPNGGHILFNTSGVNTENKQHFVFRKYDENANIVKDKAFSFNYQCLPYVKEIELAPGKFDYVLVTLPINYKKSELPVNPANQYEYFRIDGTSFEIKEHFSITAPKSQWRINQVFEKNGELYLIGDAGKSNDVYQDFSIPKASDFPNFQIAKIANSQLSYVNAFGESDIKANLLTISGEKVKPEMHFKAIDIQMDVANGKFIYSGQQTDDGQRAECMLNAVFSADGQLEAFIAKKTEFAMGNLVFSKDKNTMHWLLNDVTEYNKWDSKTGVITAKESKQVLTALSVISYNLSNKTMQYQTMQNEDWGVQYKNPVLFDNDNEVLLLGGKLTRKAKESEVVFITLKK